MSLIWADNFQSYGYDETKLTDGIYAQAQNGSLVDDPDTNATGIVYGGSVFTLRFALPAGATTSGGIAHRRYFNSLPASTPIELFSFRDGSNTSQVLIACTSTGILQAYRGEISGGTLLDATTAPAITAAAWNHIEVKVLISDTVGTVEIRVNGVIKLNLSNIDTKNTTEASYSQVKFSSSSVSSFIKDVCIWDTNGSQNNDFLGTVAVYSARPSSDISFNWSASTGSTGYNLIDEAIPDDADYISAADPPPAASTFGLEDAPPDVTSIKGVVTVARMRKTDGGDCNIQMAMVSGVSEDLGADRPITSAFTYWWDISETDPATVAPWTPVGFNAANLKINRTL